MMTVGCDRCAGGQDCACRYRLTLRQRTELVGEQYRIDAELAHARLVHSGRMAGKATSLAKGKRLEEWAERFVKNWRATSAKIKTPSAGTDGV